MNTHKDKKEKWIKVPKEKSAVDFWLEWLKRTNTKEYLKALKAVKPNAKY
jgi:hypothetical protein